MLQSFIKEIAEIIPSKRLNSDYMRRLAWGTDAGFYRHVPQLVIHSENEEEIVQIIRMAQKTSCATHIQGCRHQSFGAKCNRFCLSGCRAKLGEIQAGGR